MQSFDSKDESIPLYVDLLSNGGFKAVFGDVEYLPVDRLGPVVDVNTEFQYDFLCRDASGAVYIVEMQRYHEVYWFKRCVSYASRVYDRQNRKGGVYDVPPVYLIGLMGTEINHPDKEFWRDRYVSEYTFREKDCHDLLDETTVIIFAELAGFSEDKRIKYDNDMNDERRLRGIELACRRIGYDLGADKYPVGY